MHRGRTVLAYATVGIACLALATVISPDLSHVEGPGPLVFAPILTAKTAGWLFLAGAAVFALGVEPEWATANGAS